MSNLDEARKTYTRVTSVLYPHSGLQQIDAEVVQHAADRGTRVHKICEGILSGVGDYGMDAECVGYVESFKQWLATVSDKVHLQEHRFWHDEARVTGQADLILETPEGLVIIDLKTSSRPSLTWPVQGAAYAWLARHNGLDIKKIMFIHLNRHGKPPKIYEYPLDDELWLACLKVYNHFYKDKDHG